MPVPTYIGSDGWNPGTGNGVISVTAGDYIFVWIFCNQPGVTLSVSDGVNSYTSLGIVTTTGAFGQAFYAIASTSTTLTIVSSGATMAFHMLCNLIAFSGVTALGAVGSGDNAGFGSIADITFSLTNLASVVWNVDCPNAPAIASGTAVAMCLDIGSPDTAIVFLGSRDPGEWGASISPTINGYFPNINDNVGTGDNRQATVLSGVPPTSGPTLACPSSSAQVGVPYSSSFVVTGGTGPYTFAIISGSLPTGLNLNTSTGAVTGTPTTHGTYSYVGQVTDSLSATATANCSITVAPATLTLSCPSSVANLGVSYSSAFVASGGVSPYTFTIISGSLPPGLSLNGATGAVTGIPTVPGSYTFTGQVTDSVSVTATCTITINVNKSINRILAC
jgi:hypothetical protein